MPLIYQARCENCSHAGALYLKEYGAVYLDEPHTRGRQVVFAKGMVHSVAAKSAVATFEDPRLLVLAPPMEREFLAQAGLNHWTVRKVGRYVRINPVVCVCGTIFDVRRLTSPPWPDFDTGCLPALFLPLSVGLWLQSFLAGFAALIIFGYLWLKVARMLGVWFVRRRYPGRARDIDGPFECPGCESRQFAKLPTDWTLPCSECKVMAMRFFRVGRADASILI